MARQLRRRFKGKGVIDSDFRFHFNLIKEKMEEHNDYIKLNHDYHSLSIRLTKAVHLGASRPWINQ